MTSVFEKRSQERKQEIKQPNGSAFQQRAAQKGIPEEPWYKELARTAYQPISGALQAMTYASDIALMMGQGDALADMDEIEENLTSKGIPFDREKYMEGLQAASEYFPTQGNIERGLESTTGAPLTPKTRLQKGIKFASMIGKAIPKKGTEVAPHGTTFRGLNTNLPRPVLGIGVEGVKELIQEAGAPEPLSELASLLVLKGVSPGGGSLSVGKTIKPSGMVERRFESLREPREVSQNKLNKISKKVESDFRGHAFQIIRESPVGETAKQLAENPAYRTESIELLNEAQTIADGMPGGVSSTTLKKEIADISAKQRKGYAANEYDKKYSGFMNEALDEIAEGNVPYGQMIEQYRKNNTALGEYFEPGSSKALNRAKRDALLDQNRAITAALEKAAPESELVPVFKEGNARWSRLKDMDAIDDFVNSVFTEKINYRSARDFFEDANYQRIFKRALGEEGFKKFETLTKDLLTSEQPYKMLKVAKSKGFQDLFETAGAYVLHPTIGQAKLTLNASKKAFRWLMNSMLDNPKIAIQLEKGVKDLKKGNFAEAEKTFNVLKAEVEQAPKAAAESETIDVTGKSSKQTVEQGLKEHGIDLAEAPAEAAPKQIETKLVELPKESKKPPAKTKERAAKEFLESKKAKEETAPIGNPTLYTQEDFPTKAEAKEYLDHLMAYEKQISAGTRKTRRSHPETLKNLEDLIEELGKKENSSKKQVKKPEKKNKVQAIEEGLQVAKSNLEKREGEYKSAANDAFKKVKKQRFDAAKQRVKDLEEDLKRMKELEGEEKGLKSQKRAKKKT